MDKQQLYANIWKNALPDMLAMLEHGINPAIIALSEAEFETVGDRQKYAFRLEIRNGVPVNHVKGSAVSRDLADVFAASPKAVAMSQKHLVVLRLGSNFAFTGSLHL